VLPATSPSWAPATSTTAGKFAAVALGQWIEVRGCTLNPARMFLLVTAKAGDALTVSGVVLVDETPAGAAVALRGALLRNGATFTSFTIQKRLGAALGFAYPGTYFTGGQINAKRGEFFSGTLDALCKSEEKAAAALGSGFLAAPTNRVISTATNMKSVRLDGGALPAKITSVQATFTKEGAKAQFAYSDDEQEALRAQGMVRGQFTVSGSLEAYFDSFALYDRYKAETGIHLSYRVVDEAGNAIIVSFPVVVLGKATITGRGQNDSVMAQFEFGADPDPVTGCTMQLDRFPAP
jgi:hypothetical protein